MSAQVYCSRCPYTFVGMNAKSAAQMLVHHQKERHGIDPDDREREQLRDLVKAR